MTNALVPINMPELMEIGKVMAASGFFEDARQANQAIVKVLAGRELGFGPFASMTGIHIIKGKPVISANLYAAAIRGSGRYDYKVIRLDDTGCELAFYENGKEVGRSAFTDKDAKAAGLIQAGGPWTKFPRNMYFARAISNGAHWYCPDVFGGASVYTPGEMGEETTVDLSTGEIITVTATPVPESNGQPAQPEPAAVKVEMAPPMTEGQRKRLHGLGNAAYGPDWDAKRHELVTAITKGRTDSSKLLSEAEAAALIRGIERKLDASTVQVGEQAPAFPADSDLHPASAHLEPA